MRAVRGFLSPWTIIGCCLVLLAAAAFVGVLVGLATCSAFRVAGYLAAQVHFQAGAAARSGAEALSWGRLVKASGACGTVFGLVVSARFVVDLRLQGWLGRAPGSAP